MWGDGFRPAAVLYRENIIKNITSYSGENDLMPDLDLRGIDWVIVGGESGPGARLMHPSWPAEVRDQCLAACVPFFFKQWGGPNKKKA